MSYSIFWFDVETSGLDCHKHAMIELAFMIEQDRNIIETGHYLIAPHAHCSIDGAALRIHGRTEEEIYAFLNPELAFAQLTKQLQKHVNPYNKFDKLVQAGYNVGFDDGFLRAFWRNCGDRYYGSWFFSARIDVMSFVAARHAESPFPVSNFKLETLCKHFEIQIDAHQAMSDIEATRQLYYKLKEEK